MIILIQLTFVFVCTSKGWKIWKRSLCNKGTQTVEINRFVLIESVLISLFVVH